MGRLVLEVASLKQCAERRGRQPAIGHDLTEQAPQHVCSTFCRFALGRSQLGLSFGLRDQAQLELGELFKLPEVGKHVTVVGAVVIDKGNGRCRYSRPSHGFVPSSLGDEDNAHVCGLYAQIVRREGSARTSAAPNIK